VAITEREEQRRAEALSAAVDQLLAGTPQGGLLRGEALEVDPADAGLLDAARELARLPALLGPVHPALEERVMRQVRATERPAPRPAGRAARRLPRFRPSWAFAGLVTLLLVALLVTPLGNAAVASFRAVFDLGRTDVAITQATTPTVTAGAAGVRQAMTLEEAQAAVAFEIPEPAYLPAGYRLLEVNGYSYPDLPAWMPQPFFIELIYGDGEGGTCDLRVYPIALGSDASVSGLRLETASVEKVQDLEIGGQPGVLLRVGGADWQELVWEHGELIMALSSGDLDDVELLQVARSVD
jgi:hypothetical protein